MNEFDADSVFKDICNALLAFYHVFGGFIITAEKIHISYISLPLSQLTATHPKWTLEEAYMLLFLPPMSRLLTKVQNYGGSLLSLCS